MLDPQRALVVLDEPAWRARAEAHEARVDALVGDHLARRGSGLKHPVHDFLFTYYSQRPAALRRWHPGFGTVLLDASELAGAKGYSETKSTGRGSRAVPFVSDYRGHSQSGRSGKLLRPSASVRVARTWWSWTSLRSKPIREPAM